MKSLKFLMSCLMPLGPNYCESNESLPFESGGTAVTEHAQTVFVPDPEDSCLHEVHFIFEALNGSLYLIHADTDSLLFCVRRC